MPDDPTQPTPEPSTPPEEATASSDSQTAQMAGNEPLAIEPEAQPTETKSSEALPPREVSSRNSTNDNLALAQQTIQNKKRAKLDKIITLFDTKPKITNDQVEHLLHVSDATATRYLDILEKEAEIKQVGKTGRAVWYSKI